MLPARPYEALHKNMEGRFEKVYTMTDYYDGPRRGIADFQGRPHFYDSEWSDDHDSYVDIFKLTAVEDDLFLLALEDWAIWRRWEIAFHEGRVDTTTHPALPEDRSRHEELQSALAQRMVTCPKQHLRARGEFRSVDVDTNQRGWRPLEVRWEPC